MIIVNLGLQLVYPIVAIQWIKSNILPAAYFMMFSTGNLLKLISFHHVMADNRNLMRRISKATEAQKKDAHFFNISEDTFQQATQYPKNLRVGHFVRYMCVPTFCYQHSYPSTDRIRPVYLLKRLLEGILLLLFSSYLFSQHAMKIAESSLPYFIEWNT